MNKAIKTNWTFQIETCKDINRFNISIVRSNYSVSVYKCRLYNMVVCTVTVVIFMAKFDLGYCILFRFSLFFLFWKKKTVGIFIYKLLLLLLPRRRGGGVNLYGQKRVKGCQRAAV